MNKEIDKILKTYGFFVENDKSNDKHVRKQALETAKQAIQALIEDIIGKDDKPTPIQRKMIGGLTVTDSARNALRAEQRKRAGL